MIGLMEALMEYHLKATRKVAVDDVYVPVKRKKSLEPKGNGRLVLVEGLHRLEACKALGEDMIKVIFVQARQF